MALGVGPPHAAAQALKCVGNASSERLQHRVAGCSCGLWARFLARRLGGALQHVRDVVEELVGVLLTTRAEPLRQRVLERARGARGAATRRHAAPRARQRRRWTHDATDRAAPRAGRTLSGATATRAPSACTTIIPSACCAKMVTGICRVSAAGHMIESAGCAVSIAPQVHVDHAQAEPSAVNR